MEAGANGLSMFFISVSSFLSLVSQWFGFPSVQHRDAGKLAGAWVRSQYEIGFHGNWLFTIAKCFGFDESAFSYGKTFLWRISSQKEIKFQHTAKSLQNRIYCAAVPISNFTLSCLLCIITKRNKCKYHCYRYL